ncbi:MAG: 50S ribosomal protein L7/L12 [Patescibacteria group bacterium]|nr:50S ribosomal protein L7/L12 [Patescibacteria group bacterium]
MVEEKKNVPASEDKKEEEKETKKEVKVPAKFKKLVEEVEKMSVLELSELVKVLEDKFGVVAAASVMAAPVAGADGGGAEEATKDAFNVELVTVGDSKIAVIKLVNEITGSGLKEAKDLVDGAPKVVKENVPTKEAEEMKKKLEEAGATIELK